MRNLRASLGALSLQVVLAFAAVYIIWGSTYLAISYADKSIPPFVMASVRFLIAGGLLYIWLRVRGAANPRLIHWRSAFIIGGLLLMCGNGFISWAELQVPSGVAAVIVAMVPIWMALLDWLRPGGVRPSAGALVGLALGFGGVALLVTEGTSINGSLSTLAIVALLVAPFCWAIGSLYSRTAPMPDSPLMGTAIEMLGGGALLLILAAITGEWGQVHVQQVTGESAIALAYLIVFGSLVAFTAYVWLLRNVTASRASTYAYVNPAVAVFLGWAVASEPITLRTLLSTAIIILAVALITASRSRTKAVVASEPEAALASEEVEPSVSR